MTLKRILEGIRTSRWTYLVIGLLWAGGATYDAVSATAPSALLGIAVAVASALYLAAGTLVLLALDNRHTRRVTGLALLAVYTAVEVLFFLGHLAGDPAMGPFYLDAAHVLLGAGVAWLGLGILAGYLNSI